MTTKHYIVISTLIFATQFSQAQVHFDIASVSNSDNLKVDTTDIRYYYYPNLQSYYDTKRGLYIIKQNNSWITSESITSCFRGYSLKNNFYIVLKGYVGDEPYQFIEEHKHKYPADFSSKRKPKDIAIN